jgi:hypothetical protein
MAGQVLEGRIGPAATLDARAVTAAVNGVGVDLAGWNAAMIVISVGTFGGTSPSATLEIQDSNDLRLAVTAVSGTSPSLPLAAVVVRGKPMRA